MLRSSLGIPLARRSISRTRITPADCSRSSACSCSSADSLSITTSTLDSTTPCAVIAMGGGVSTFPQALSSSSLYKDSSNIRYFSTLSLASSSSLLHQRSTSTNFHHPLLANHHHHLLHHHHNHNHCTTQIRTKVFVSQHNDMNITSNQILDYCSNRGIHNLQHARVTSSHVILEECPFCNKPTNGKADNCYKCYVQIGGGAFFCHRCGNKGSWFDFKSMLRGYDHNVSSAGGQFNGITATAAAAATDAGVGPAIASARKDGTQRGNHSKGPVVQLPLPKQRLQACYISNLLDSKDENVTAGATAAASTTSQPLATPQDDKRALKYLIETRGLEMRTLRKYGVGKATYSFPSDKNGQYVATECITFPWIMTVADIKEQEALRGAEFILAEKNKTDDTNKTNDTTTCSDTDFITRRIKVRALEQKAWQRLDPAGGGWGLFGFHTVPDGATEVVLTEGEYDAMAVWQATGRPAISLPNGCRSLPMEVLPMLERFSKVYLWMDNDAPGQEGAKQFAQKIGLNRCYIVQPPPLDGTNDDATCKDANEALLKGLDLKAMIDAATITKHEQILDFESLRADVLHEILNPDKYTGVPMNSLPTLNNIIKGFRRGELTVLTGPTGSGKTTFLGQLSVDLAEQDVNVMWGSFEIKNTRLLAKLLQQFSRKPLPTGSPDAPAILHQLADRFSSLPMYFLKFHGGSDLEDVLDAMEYAVYVHDVEHIILDNLQFMISRNSLNKSFDKFDIQDIAIEKFRKFATDRNVHVTLVVHPRKEDEASKLSMSSIYGSAKATQEADTVMILQSDNSAGRHRKYIEVKKNRFDGTLGFCPLHFDRMGGRYDDVPK